MKRIDILPDNLSKEDELYQLNMMADRFLIVQMEVNALTKGNKKLKKEHKQSSKLRTKLRNKISKRIEQLKKDK